MSHNDRRVLKKLARAPFGPWETRRYPRAGLSNGETWWPECYVNNRYSVQLSDVPTEWGAVIHLWIRCHVPGMPRSWRDLQRIKDTLVGADRVAVEVFPPDSELVDEADMAHLWVLPSGMALPFSLKRRAPGESS